MARPASWCCTRAAGKCPPSGSTSALGNDDLASMPDAGSVDFILVRESGMGGYGQDTLGQARIVGTNDCP